MGHHKFTACFLLAITCTFVLGRAAESLSGSKELLDVPVIGDKLCLVF